jgi:uncharacterized protein (DUF4415 family)
MAKKERIVRVSAEQLRAMRDRGESRSDWKAAAAMSPADVERLANEEDGALPAGWESTVEIGLPEPRQPVHIRLDAAVLRWFKAHGPGYQTRINAVLRAFVQARQRAEPADLEPHRRVAPKRPTAAVIPGRASRERAARR